MKYIIISFGLNPGGTPNDWVDVGSGGVTINGNTNGNILTATGSANTIDGESSLRLAGDTILHVDPTWGIGGISIKSSSYNSSGPSLFLAKQNSGTTTPEVNLGDNIGNILFSAKKDSGNLGIVCQIKVEATQDYITTSTGCEFNILTVPEGTTTRSSRFLIDGTGHTYIQNGNLTVDSGQFEVTYGSVSFPIDVVAESSDVAANDPGWYNWHTLLANPDRARSIVLPDNASFKGAIYVIKNITTGPYDVTVTRNGTDTIFTNSSGNFTVLLNTTGETVIVQSLGNGIWYSWFSNSA